jgi:alkylated DNA repair dioxygenase AlkB
LSIGLSLKARVEEVTPATAYENLSLPKLGYNAVLCNLYRDGNGSVGLHADAEPEMGPVIASISLGAERPFRLKRKGGMVAFSQRLPHGSLLVMAGRHRSISNMKSPNNPVSRSPASTLPSGA